MSDVEGRLQRLEEAVSKISRQLDRLEEELGEAASLQEVSSQTVESSAAPPAPITMVIISSLFFFGLLSLLAFILELAGIIGGDGNLYRYAFTGAVLITAIITIREVFTMKRTDAYLYNDSLRFSLIIALTISIGGAAWLVYDLAKLFVESVESLQTYVIAAAAGLVIILSLVVLQNRR